MREILDEIQEIIQIFELRVERWEGLDLPLYVPWLVGGFLVELTGHLEMEEERVGDKTPRS